MKKTVVLAVRSRVKEPKKRKVCLEGRKDMTLKERLVELNVYGNGSRPGGPVSASFSSMRIDAHSPESRRKVIVEGR